MAQTTMLRVAPAEQLAILCTACIKAVKERLLSSRVPFKIWYNGRWCKHGHTMLRVCWLDKRATSGIWSISRIVSMVCDGR